MKFFYKLTLILILLSFLACSKKDKEVILIKEQNLDLQMIEAYKEGLSYLKKQDAIAAAKKFNEAELLYPQSAWAPKSLLMSAYSYYSEDYYGDAIKELERYFKTYPNDQNIGYASYLIAICYYESIVDEKKDLGSIIKAEEKFKIVIKNYPNTDFAIDAEFKLGLIKDVMASKEIYIGRHYIKKEKWIPAINRFKKVVTEYDTTIYVEEAIHRLVEIHYKIGLEDEAKKYAKLLAYNYGSGEWYKKTYKLFNKKYEKHTKKVKKNKKNSLIKNFKSLVN